MMTKLPSRKAAGIKILTGLLVALALVVVFACEKKNSTTSATVPAGILAIESTDSLMKISGSPEDVLKVDSILRSRDYQMTIVTDKEENKSYILFKKSASEQELSPVFFIVEEMPEYPGGEVALREFIAKNVSYPPIAQENGIQGKVYVTFVVSADGSVKNAKIARGVDPILDQEALRVVYLMPRWKPGKQRGQNVNVSYTVPISFVLQ